MTLTDKFNLLTLIHSDTAIKNGYAEQSQPSDAVVDHLEELYNAVLLPLVKSLLGTMNVTCAYRCPRLNVAVGGAPASQHVQGFAADVEYYEGGQEQNDKLIAKALELKLDFDQMIGEGKDENGRPRWVHISYVKGKNRKQHFYL